MPSNKNNRSALRIWQIGLFLGFLAFWHVATSPTLLPPLYFDNPHKAAFFFGEPLSVISRIWDWFSSGTIYEHLWVTLLETLLAFVPTINAASRPAFVSAAERITSSHDQNRVLAALVRAERR